GFFELVVLSQTLCGGGGAKRRPGCAERSAVDAAEHSRVFQDFEVAADRLLGDAKEAAEFRDAYGSLRGNPASDLVAALLGEHQARLSLSQSMSWPRTWARWRTASIAVASW